MISRFRVEFLGFFRDFQKNDNLEIIFSGENLIKFNNVIKLDWKKLSKKETKMILKGLS